MAVVREARATPKATTFRKENKPFSPNQGTVEHMARRRKPHDPAAAIHASLERKDREAEIARMEAQGATVSTDRGGQILSAFRSNVFNLLLSRGTITPNHHDAAHTLCLAWAQWKGLDGKPEAAGLVSGGGGCREIVTDRMIRGGRRVAEALGDLPAEHRPLIERLVSDAVEQDRPRVWRVQVQEVTGLTTRDRQTRAVVAALEALRLVYEGPVRVAA